MENENIEEIELENEVAEDTSTKKEAKLKLELEETSDRLNRVRAEFENYKKRETKEREMLHKSVLANIVSSLLPVIDNLEHAVKTETEDEGYKQGVELVQKQLIDMLGSFGVEEIETIGTTFDPEVHEAVSSVADEGLGVQEVKEVFRKGYKVGTKVIRHAMVSVAN